MLSASKNSDLARLAVVAHYVIMRTEPEMLGATKLNKVLWYSDLEHYRRTGRSLTGASHYVRMPQGPVPHCIDEALGLLKKEGSITERLAKVHDFERREFVWLKRPDISVFTAEQIDLINELIDRIKPMSAKRISDNTHLDAMWLELSDGEAMPISASSVMVRQPTEAQLSWAQKVASEAH